MKKQDYEQLREKKQFEPLWLDLLNASGYAGVLPNGGLVDRRYYPEALPVQANRHSVKHLHIQRHCRYKQTQFLE